jgi:hypothetical protein
MANMNNTILKTLKISYFRILVINASLKFETTGAIRIEKPVAKYGKEGIVIQNNIGNQLSFFKTSSFLKIVTYNTAIKKTVIHIVKNV